MPSVPATSPPWAITMETESVKSGSSELSSRIRRIRSPTGSKLGNHTRSFNYPNSRGPKTPHKLENGSRTNSPMQTTLNMLPDERPEGQEVIEVQILPQDDNWGDNTTAITSEHSISMDDFGRWSRDPDSGLSFTCQRYLGSFLAGIFSLFAFLSPVAMVVLPKLEIIQLKRENLKCSAECDGMLISFAFKLLILLVGTWALFFRQPKATMPRIFIFRALVVALVFVFTFAYWLFYIVRVLENREEIQYYSLVVFAVSLVDALLFINYLAVILIEIRQLQPQYVIKIVRSPDGECRTYPIGQFSIQRAAVWVLERYYTDFCIYNPYLERLPVSKTKKGGSSFKYYEIDGISNNAQGQSRSPITASTRRRDSSHNERFYEEHEYERRVKKRRARLITAAEEAFTHIKRLHEEQSPGNPMDPHEAAQAIFPSMARALQKYLRLTRQQPRHSMETILQHLATCLSFDMSPRAFLERYISTAPVIQNDKEQKSVQTWALICDTLLSRAIKHGTLFQLRQSDVALLCSVSKMPHFNVTEEIIDPKSNRFVLRLNSETEI